MQIGVENAFLHRYSDRCSIHQMNVEKNFFQDVILDSRTKKFRVTILPKIREIFLKKAGIPCCRLVCREKWRKAWDTILKNCDRWRSSLYTQLSINVPNVAKERLFEKFWEAALSVVAVLQGNVETQTHLTNWSVNKLCFSSCRFSILR